jgi:hypothetical protein
MYHPIVGRVDLSGFALSAKTIDALRAVLAPCEKPCGLVDFALIANRAGVHPRGAARSKVRAAGRLCASVLAAGQESVCRAWSSKRPDKFTEIDWSLSEAGSPRITGAHAWIDCESTRCAYRAPLTPRANPARGLASP